MEIHEAYKILSDETSRARYDHELWLSGQLYERKLPITPKRILDDLDKLNLSIAELNVYSINLSLLNSYLLFLLNDHHLAIISAQQSDNYPDRFIRKILKAVDALPLYYAIPLLQRMKPAFLHQEHLTEIILQKEKKLKAERLRSRLMPWLILLLTLLLCVCMYFFNR